MSIDGFLSAEYDDKNYTCLHFASDVMRHLTGVALFERLSGFLEGRGDISQRRSFKRLKSPVSPCVVLFRGDGESHVGVYVRGKVVHLTEVGARYQEVCDAILGFRDVRYYQC